MSSSNNTSLDSFLQPLSARLSNYTISKSSPIADSHIQSIIEFAIKHAPSTFNVQSARAVILFGADHEKLWDIGDEEIKKVFSDSAYQYVQARIKGFRAGHGTVLWFEDQVALDTLKGKNKGIQHAINDWSLHSSGIHQFIAWTALQIEGLGCNLQHYNFMPEFSARVLKEWSLPDSWRLEAQLVFGAPVDGLKRSKPREYQPLEDRVKVFGAS